jgi:zinc transporter
MVSIRLWVEPGRIVSVRQRRLMSVDDLRASLAQGAGPVDEGDFLVQLAERLVARMVDVINDVDDAVDAVQAEVLRSGSVRLRSELTRLRHEIIALRRYLAPQRDALLRLGQVRPAWLHEEHQLLLREQADRVTRFVEDLDAARDRAAVTQEELGNRLSEQMNTRMYVLSLVAAVFLPLGFLTGLFGINVGGMPLAEDPWGFWEVSGLLATITAIQVLLFRWRGWF